jgi:hypothetical protein
MGAGCPRIAASIGHVPSNVGIHLKVPSALVRAMDELFGASGLTTDQQAHLALARQNALAFKRLAVGARPAELRKMIFQDTAELHPVRNDGVPSMFTTLFPDGYCEPATKIRYSKSDLVAFSIHIEEGVWMSVEKISKTAGNMTQGDLFVLAMNRLLVFSANVRRNGVSKARLRDAIHRDLKSAINGLDQNVGEMN